MSVKRIVCDECGTKLIDHFREHKDYAFVGKDNQVRVQFVVDFNQYWNLDICPACAVKRIKEAAKKL